MNIAITTHVNPAINNGLGQYIKFLIKGLQEVDSDHHFYIIVNKEFEEYLEIYHPNFKIIRVDIPHHPRPIMRPAYFLWQNILAGRLLRKYEIDVFHLPNPIPLFNTFEVPHVVTIHDAAEYSEHRHKILHRRFRMLVNESSAKRTAKILTVSEFSKSEISRFIDVEESKIHLTHLGVTLNLEANPVQVNQNSKPYFLHVGGTRSNKNIERIINSFLSSGCLEKMNLYFVGQNSHLNQSEKELKDLEKKGVYFVGYVSEKELISYYKGAVGLIYPSLYEGFGLPILEAMALGVPVITSNRASMPEVAGEAALYVNPEEVSSIRKAMEKLMGDVDLRESLKMKGIQQSQKFDWKTTAQKTILAYEEAAKKKT